MRPPFFFGTSFFRCDHSGKWRVRMAVRGVLF